MAEISFGMCIPHSGMLGQKPEDWLTNASRDFNNPELWFQGKTWTYPELEAHRGKAFEPYLTIEERTARQQRCVAAIAEMRAAYERADVDVAIVLGKDQKEIWPDQSPTFTIYSGEKVFNGPPQRAVYAPDHPVVHDAHPKLARYLLESLHDHFDLNDLQAWPENVWMERQTGKKADYPVVPHAYSFIYHQVMGDNPPPHVPFILNLFYPPTQPSMKRCIQLGHALRDALTAWDSGVKVAMMGSGGLSHFVNDEEFDQRIMKALGSYDYAALEAIPDVYYQSGTSEVKLYSTVMTAMEHTGAKMTLVDYVPCWRTAAGTGEGMGFMYWQP